PSSRRTCPRRRSPAGASAFTASPRASRSSASSCCSPRRARRRPVPRAARPSSSRIAAASSRRRAPRAPGPSPPRAPRPASPALSGLFTAARAARGMPAALGRAFARAHAERPFALAVVEHSHAARYALGAGIPVLLDEHNVESAYRRAAVDARGGLVRAALGRRDAALLAHWERRVWQAADRVVCVTEDDARAIAAVRGEPPAVVPNGVDTGKVPFVPPSSRTGSEILFVGLMDHPPNVRAAERLAREVMPRVWAARADARLVLCGANPAREVRALASERVLVTGRVPEVARSEEHTSELQS